SVPFPKVYERLPTRPLLRSQQAAAPAVFIKCSSSSTDVTIPSPTRLVRLLGPGADSRQTTRRFLAPLLGVRGPLLLRMVHASKGLVLQRSKEVHCFHVTHDESAGLELGVLVASSF